MAINPEQLKQIIHATLNPDPNVRKAAEEQLNAAQITPGYASQVLQLVASSDGIHDSVRQASAVLFKNTIKKGWDAEDGKESGILISPQDRELIKNHLVELMCTTPTPIQSQLSESISLIAKSDYPKNWDGLLPQLVQQFTSPDQKVVNGVLLTAHSIFKSFRYVARSDELYAVILYTLKGIQEPILTLLKQTSQAVSALQNDPVQLKPRFETLFLIFRIAFSLVYQDLPEYFEDHMGEWMEECSKYLQPNIFPSLTDADEETEPSPLDKVQVAVIDLLRHYAVKDEEAFIEGYLPNITSLVWQLLLSVSAFPKHDNLATTSIRFLSGLVAKPMHRHLFENEDTLKQIVLNIVIPNLYFRESDEERFEDDPFEFMLTEVEGSDSETRRTCSQEMLKAMCRQFEPATNVCIGHIESMVAKDAKGQDWREKDAAINLMMGVAIKAETRNGVTQVNPAANVLQFFQTQVLPELQDSNVANRPVVKATAIKFVATFRNQFSREHLVELFPLLINHLSSNIVVVHTFAAYAIERVLACKDDTGVSKFGRSELEPVISPLFTGLFAIMDNKAWNENFYVIKCNTKALATIDDGVLPVVETCIQKYAELVQRVAPNPGNPQFNHFLFESIAVLIRNVCRKDPTTTGAFESFLFPIFTEILRKDIEEFTPYVFQILAQILEYRPEQSGLGESYTNLFPLLLNGSSWVKGKIPALARLVQAYLRKAGEQLVAHVTPLLGTFQKLLAVRATEEHSFMVLNAVITYMPLAAFQAMLPEVFRLLFTRLRASSSPKYKTHLTKFFAIFVGKYGAELFCTNAEGLQAGLSAMVVQNVWAKHIIDNPSSQKTLAKTQLVGLTKLSCGSPIFLTNGAWNPAWAAAIAAAFTIVGSQTLKDSEIVADLAGDDMMEVSFDAQFSQLQYAKRPVDDPFPGVVEPVAEFCQELTRLSAQFPGRLQPLLDQAVMESPKLQSGFQGLLQSKAITLS